MAIFSRWCGWMPIGCSTRSRSRSGTPAVIARYSFSVVRASNWAASAIVHRVGLGHDQHAARIAIQPVDDARPRLAADRAELLEVKREGAGQRAAPMPAGRMHDHPRRLVDRDDVLIFIENVERDVLRMRPRRIHRRQNDANPVPGAQLVGDLSPLFVDLYAPGADHLAKLHATMLRQRPGQKHIQPQARIGRSNDQFQRLGREISGHIRSARFVVSLRLGIRRFRLGRRFSCRGSLGPWCGWRRRSGRRRGRRRCGPSRRQRGLRRCGNFRAQTL